MTTSEPIKPTYQKLLKPRLNEFVSAEFYGQENVSRRIEGLVTRHPTTPRTICIIIDPFLLNSNKLDEFWLWFDKIMARGRMKLISAKLLLIQWGEEYSLQQIKLNSRKRISSYIKKEEYKKYDFEQLCDAIVRAKARRSDFIFHFTDLSYPLENIKDPRYYNLLCKRKKFFTVISNTTAKDNLIKYKEETAKKNIVRKIYTF